MVLYWVPFCGTSGKKSCCGILAVSFFFGLFIFEWRNECKSSLVPSQEEELYACQRGCRLFSICQFVDDGIDLNRTKLECDSGKNSELL